jgi:5'-nucleotidase
MKNEQQPQRILVDMDGVIADLEQGFLDKFKIKYPYLPFVQLSNRTTFYIREDYPKNIHPEVESIYTAPDFFANLPPISGAIDALNEMQQFGHTVKICTSPLTRYQYCVEEKYYWVEKNLGKEWVKNLILTKDKTEVRGDLLIDDKPKVEGDLNPTWEHILFDQPYNRMITGQRRLLHWNKWQQLIHLSNNGSK